MGSIQKTKNKVGIMYSGDILPILVICLVLTIPVVAHIFGWKFNMTAATYCPKCGWGVSHVIPSETHLYFVHSEGVVCKVERVPAGEEAPGIGDS